TPRVFVRSFHHNPPLLCNPAHADILRHFEHDLEGKARGQYLVGIWSNRHRHAEAAFWNLKLRSDREWLVGRRSLRFPDHRAGVALTAIVRGVLFIKCCAPGARFLRPINGTLAGSRGGSRQMRIDIANDLRLEPSRVVLRWSLRLFDEYGPELVPIVVS